MPNIIAQVASGVVANLAVVIPGSSFDATDNGAFTAVDVTSVSPRPGIGWAYSGGTFTAPAPVTALAPRDQVKAFGRAVAVSDAVSTAGKQVVASLLWPLLQAIEDDDTAVVTSMWSALAATLGSGDVSAIQAAASTNGISL
jgi:hypothetical protein